MTKFQIEMCRVAAKPGMFIIYNDGRAGHTNSKAVILRSDKAGMVVQFADMAQPDRINFADDAWMKHIVFSAV